MFHCSLYDNFGRKIYFWTVDDVSPSFFLSGWQSFEFPCQHTYSGCHWRADEIWSYRWSSLQGNSNFGRVKLVSSGIVIPILKRVLFFLLPFSSRPLWSHTTCIGKADHSLTFEPGNCNILHGHSEFFSRICDWRHICQWILVVHHRWLKFTFFFSLRNAMSEILKWLMSGPIQSV